jgi:hypothetical protein
MKPPQIEGAAFFMGTYRFIAVFNPEESKLEHMQGWRKL